MKNGRAKEERSRRKEQVINGLLFHLRTKKASKVSPDVTNQAGMTKEIAERAVNRAFGNQRFRGSDKIQEVRICGKDFDITIKFAGK